MEAYPWDHRDGDYNARLDLIQNISHTASCIPVFNMVTRLNKIFERQTV